MADLNERDSKLIQYLSEAYGKERELETSLQAHIAMTTRPPYKKRLQQHLRETKAHGKALERRIKQLGGGGQTSQSVVGRMQAAAKGPLHMLRGSGEQEKMLKNAKTEYFNEHEEIATYTAIEVLAAKVGDRETAMLAKRIRREEERMAKFLEGQIKALTGAVVVEEVPAAQRRSGSASRKRRASSSNGASGSRRRASGGKRSTGAKGSAGKRSAKVKRARKPARSGRG